MRIFLRSRLGAVRQTAGQGISAIKLGRATIAAIAEEIRRARRLGTRSHLRRDIEEDKGTTEEKGEDFRSAERS